MDTDINNRRATATIVGSAGIFAAAFWLLDSGSVLWKSNSSVFTAIVPEGDEFVLRLIYAAMFAAAGWIAGAAAQRCRDLKGIVLDDLADSERKYRALLASSFDSVLILNKNSQIVEASESAAALLGTSANSLKGLNLDSFVDVANGDSSSADPSVSKILHDVQGNLECSMAVNTRDQNGRRFPAEIRISSMSQGEDSAFLLAVRETTSTVVAQKALRHSERRYQALFDNIPGGVFRGLSDGRLLAANPALATMLGYDSVEELISAGNINGFFLDKQERNSLIGQLEKTGSARNMEMQLRRQDDAAITVLANVQAVGQESHEGLIYEGILTDISDLQEAREALLDSEEHFRALCEHSLDVINVIDASGKIEYSSPSSTALSSRAPEEQVGLPLLRNVHPDDIDTVRQIVGDGFARPGTPHHFTCRVFREDGTLRVIDAVGTAFMTRKGQLRAVIQSRDVTAGSHRSTDSSLINKAPNENSVRFGEESNDDE